MPKKAEKTKLGELCLNIKKKCTVEVMKKILNNAKNNDEKVKKAIWKVIKPKKDIHMLDYKAVRDWFMSCSFFGFTSRIVNGKTSSELFGLYEIRKGSKKPYDLEDEWDKNRERWSKNFDSIFDETKSEELKKLIGENGDLKKLVTEARDAMKASINKLIDEEEKKHMDKTSKVQKLKKKR